MYTNCSQLTLSDYQDSVIENLINNIKENKVNHHHNNGNFETLFEEVKKSDVCQDLITLEGNKINISTFKKGIKGCK
jgi:hypothetical protein